MIIRIPELSGSVNFSLPANNSTYNVVVPDNVSPYLLRFDTTTISAERARASLLIQEFKDESSIIYGRVDQLEIESGSIRNDFNSYTASFDDFTNIFSIVDDTVNVNGDLIVSGSATLNQLFFSSSLIVSGGVVDFTLTDNVIGSFSGSFQGNGNFESFIIKDTILWDASSNFLISQKPNDTELTVGNSHNDYEYKQKTTFKNAEVVVSGSMKVTKDGILILEPHSIPPTPISGGVYYSTDGAFFVGINGG